LLKAHKLLMQNLVKEAGDYRSKGVGIFQGKKLAHMAPPAKQVPRLMNDLFGFLANNQELSWLLKSCIFHYEFEFIHPFEDGNGRMGRLWHQLLLIKEHPLFEYLSVEEIIKNRQKDYYEALAKSDKASESTAFIEFSLESILEAISVYSSNKIEPPKDAQSRLAFTQKRLRSDWFSRQDYHKHHPDISTATASRDLAVGIRQHVLNAQGNKNQRLYQFKPEKF
jgi:Fic family protein